MAGRFIALLMVAVAAHLGRGANPTTAAAADTPAVPIAHVERLVGEWALTMLVVVAAWVVLAVAASVLRRLPGSVGRLAGGRSRRSAGRPAQSHERRASRR